MEAVNQLAPTVGIASACEALGVARASFYRQPVFGPAASFAQALLPFGIPVAAAGGANCRT